MPQVTPFDRKRPNAAVMHPPKSPSISSVYLLGTSVVRYFQPMGCSGRGKDPKVLSETPPQLLDRSGISGTPAGEALGVELLPPVTPSSTAEKVLREVRLQKGEF